jgi:hypothetical protein
MGNKSSNLAVVPGERIRLTADFVTPREKILEELTCAICLEVYRNPVVLINCLHTFCEECLQRNGALLSSAM